MYRLKTIYNDYSTCCYDFILGIDSLNQRAVDRAASHFSQACEKTPRRHYNYMKYQSYLGLTHVLRGQGRGLELCRQAIKYGEAEGDLYMNLARAQWFQKQRLETLRTLEAGLVIDAEHMGLHQMRKQLGVRRFTPLPFLPRQHFLNAWLGRKLRKK